VNTNPTLIPLFVRYAKRTSVGLRDKMIIKCPHCGKEIELSMTDPFKDDNDEKE
jgi:hypothetical protein